MVLGIEPESAACIANSLPVVYQSSGIIILISNIQIKTGVVIKFKYRKTYMQTIVYLIFMSHMHIIYMHVHIYVINIYML